MIFAEKAVINLPTRFIQGWARPHSNFKVLTVGPANAASVGMAGANGFPVDFTSIGAAMDAIPVTDPNDNFVTRWLILVTPGYYEEEIHMKPFVSLTGLDHDSVYIAPPADGTGARRAADAAGRRAGVYLNYFTSISNLILVKRDGSTPTDYVVWNKDVYGVPALNQGNLQAGSTLTDVSKFGLTNVDMMPFGNAQGKAILFEGNWTTAILTNVLSGYLASTGYNVEISGQGQGADCHLSGCFFDSLLIADENGGCMSVASLYDLHIRNSLLRTAPPVGWDPSTPAPGAGLAVLPGGNVTLEGTSLQAGWPGIGGSYRVLDVSDGGRCDYYHSSTDSIRGRQNVVQKGPLPNFDGQL